MSFYRLKPSLIVVVGGRTEVDRTVAAIPASATVAIHSADFTVAGLTAVAFAAEGFVAEGIPVTAADFVEAAFSVADDTATAAADG